MIFLLSIVFFETTKLILKDWKLESEAFWFLLVLHVALFTQNGDKNSHFNCTLKQRLYQVILLLKDLYLA